MSGKKKAVFLKCLLTVLALALAVVARPAERKAGFSSGSALERALAELGLEPKDVSAGYNEMDSTGATEREGHPGLKLAGSDLGRSLRWLEETALRLDSMSQAEDFLDWVPLEAQAADTLAPDIREDTVPEKTRGDESYLALAWLGDSLETRLPGAGGVIEALLASDSLVQRAFRRLEPAERRELVGLIRDFRPEEDQWPGYPVERMVSLGRRVDLEAFRLSGLMAARAAAALRLALESRNYPGDTLADAENNRPPLKLETPRGALIVGSPGDDHHAGPVWLVVEPGGDDTYELEGVEQGVSLIVDFAGNDLYRAVESYSLGAALCGLSWLEDLSGDDSYEAAGCSLTMGAAVLGVGVLVDRSGSDRYKGEGFCQGAAMFGLGLLLDTAGDDSYEAAFCGQGAVVGSGGAMLADLGGDDSYRAQGAVPDWREPGATKSWAQGAALGIRPFAAGGLALLYDRSGDDSYSVDYFGQGAGHWGAAGLLIDRDGSDLYRAGRYAQGCGLHRAAGLLADLGGDDRYEIEAVGQGAGEDRALGILLETRGCDTYRSGWMARGAAGGGGVGLLLETAGDDSYLKARKAADGFGGRWRELSSLGFLIDFGGDDTYGSGQQNGRRQYSGTWGAALDLPLQNDGR